MADCQVKRSGTSRISWFLAERHLLEHGADIFTMGFVSQEERRIRKRKYGREEPDVVTARILDRMLAPGSGNKALTLRRGL